MDDRRLWDAFIKGSYDRTAVVVADDLGIFSSLHEKPASVSALATHLGFDERATGVIVRLLASLGLLIPHDNRFHLAEDARLYLLKSSPFYWGHMMHFGVNERQCEMLIAKLEQKDSANAAGPLGALTVSGEGRSVDAWAAGQVPMQQARDIAARMHSHSLPAAIGAARNYDAVFFSNVWHDWNFRICRWLAERTFEILPSGGRIMLHEMLLDDDGAGPPTTAGFSMLMLLATQGQQFTFGELRSILEGAGFAGIETVSTYGYYSITTGYKR